MIPEEFSGGGVQRNVLGGPLGACGERPLTGFFRDGCCNTSDDDLGRHTVCAVMTAEFPRILEGCRQRPLDAAPGIWLSPACGRVTAGACAALARSLGDRCRTRVLLNATNEATLDIVTLEALKALAIDLN